MRYFAMIDGERRGPYELRELTEAGVHPDTYVWCKGMADWQKAEDVADICRYYRQTIFDRMHPSHSAGQQQQMSAPPFESAPDSPDPFGQVPLRYRNIVRQSEEIPEFSSDEPNTSVPPMNTLFIAILLTLFCFPFTGFVAIYYSYKARKTWAEAVRSESDSEKALYNDGEREDLRRRAHDYGRSAKMWVGITFFLGMIFYAFMMRHNF